MGHQGQHTTEPLYPLSVPGRFPALDADHPSVGHACAICGQDMSAGDVPALIKKPGAPEVEGLTLTAAVVHEPCLWPHGTDPAPPTEPDAGPEYVQLLTALTRPIATCDEEVSRGGELVPCEKRAVALRQDPEDMAAPPYPVCPFHTRGGSMVALVDIVAACVTAVNSVNRDGE